MPLSFFNNPLSIIFCDNSFSSIEVDEMYAEEYHAAKKMGFNVSLISFEGRKSAKGFEKSENFNGIDTSHLPRLDAQTF